MGNPLRSFLLLFLILLSSPVFFLISCESVPVDQRPRAFPSFKIQEIKEEIGWGCSYTVKIKTSCSSRRFTTDRISLAFGDAYHNEVYAPRLDDPSSGAFERCSTDTFKIQGPCGYGICYLYLRLMCSHMDVHRKGNINPKHRAFDSILITCFYESSV
ncbi:unnamed protein product [Musa acuminata subsp. malaccensis]|uniref:(wild Malaysian banana) hypothetical protein n=1 Tax=Musa acuminata subsp. malaccensis TaxID=214687 RepID=A0A8D7F436_MUSAM|nr:unnamed protein product [Musa acuminata subsp. malaccensis]